MTRAALRHAGLPNTPEGFGVQTHALVVRHGRSVALDGVDVEIRPGSITGLFGRNGSGKTTLASVIAAFRRPSAGTVLVAGQDPWENEELAPHILLVRESGDLLDDARIVENIDFFADARPYFSREVAQGLLDMFELDPRMRPGGLSRGKRSAVGIALAIAARAPLTILDEVHLGLDAPSRYLFYDALLADYVAQPRTIVLASNLIGEVERLLEDVVVLDAGRVLLHGDADSLRNRGLTVTGPRATAAKFVARRRVLRAQTLGRTGQFTVLGGLDPEAAAAGHSAGLAFRPAPLQDLFVHLTTRRERP
ncbi:MAG: ABC transporter ATP-binding protein [Micrococcales bacterium]|nr:ABC transporter ATP-binding protein [Micrococcales bacterium]